MKKLLLLSSLTSTLVYALPPMLLQTGSAVVPHDKAYYTQKLSGSDVAIIYTKDNINFAQGVAEIEGALHKDYEKIFQWKMDETLYVGLISDKNQIANGFSTQWPNNRQINYVGGSQNIDYFSSTSWIDTLIYHETAHNYQINVKGSKISQALHTVFGNGIVLLPLPLILPNVAENSFMLEGNAVLNESWHGNGGRLYSGRFQAETALQAKAGNIKPEYVYNSRLGFPYGDIYYIQGGFYNLFIAQKYGMSAANSYFKYHSEDLFWPFRTNASMKDALGVNFTKTLKFFENEQKSFAKKMKIVEGKHLASSQFYNPLGNSSDAVFFIINESGVSFPELVVVDKQSQILHKEKGSWVSGKVVKMDETYYTQGSMKTSPLKREQGLFSDWGFIKEGSASKMVQGYLSNKKSVYFDVASSYSQPQLYVGDTFYNQVNSSVIIDKNDNLYYFKQNDKTRTLYKNKTALFSYEGFYGIVCDVDSSGSIYFVANSEFGSSLYRFFNGDVKRVSSADNIIEARLLSDKELLISAISAEDYYYVKADIKSIDAKPFERKLFFEDKEYYGAYKKPSSSTEKLDLSHSYYSLLDMHYSGVDLDVVLSDVAGVTGTLNARFGDPLSQNSAEVFISRDESNITIAGAGYSNSQYLLDYQVVAYGVVDKASREDVRDSGVMALASLPFLEVGYFSGKVNLSYYQDYDTYEREPISASLTLSRYEQYGVSMYTNCLNQLTLYGVSEREDSIVGGSYTFKHDLPAEFYMGVKVKYSKSDALHSFATRGVKVSAYVDDTMDPSSIVMPNIILSTYLQKAMYSELNLAKVFNFSAYFFTFPFSLQRESLYTKYRYYKLSDFQDNDTMVNEATVGVTLSTVFLNSFILPLSLEYIYNDSNYVQNSSNFSVSLSFSF